MNIIYIVNIGSPKYSKYCIESWVLWGEKNNAKVFVLETDFIENMEPHWYKIFPFILLEENGIAFENILIVDNDTIVHSNCPNFFEDVSEEEISVVVDDSNFDWIIRSKEAYQKHVFANDPDFDIFKYFNSGFILLNKKQKKLYDEILNTVIDQKLYYGLQRVQKTYGVGRDQTPLNFLFRRHGAQLNFLSKKYNLQALLSKELVDPDKLLEMSYVSHYNSMDRSRRLYFMDIVYKKCYGEISDIHNQHHRYIC